jgi:hypothetical protein
LDKIESVKDVTCILFNTSAYRNDFREESSIPGVCLIHRKYGSIEFNQDLVSGFLTALKDFSVEFSKGSGELKVIVRG